MQLEDKLIAKKEHIGNVGDAPVYLIVTTGGLNLVVLHKSGSVEPLGIGPHPGIAKFIASKRNSGLVYNKLEKSEEDLGASRTLEIISKPWAEMTDKLAKKVNGNNT